MPLIVEKANLLQRRYLTVLRARHAMRNPGLPGRLSAAEYTVHHDITSARGCRAEVARVKEVVERGGTESDRRLLRNLERLMDVVWRVDPTPSDPNARLARELDLEKLLAQAAKEKNGWLYGAVEHVLTRHIGGYPEERIPILLALLEQNRQMMIGVAQSAAALALVGGAIGFEEIYRNAPGLFLHRVAELKTASYRRPLTSAEQDEYRVCLRLGAGACDGMQDPARRPALVTEANGKRINWFFHETTLDILRNIK